MYHEDLFCFQVRDTRSEDLRDILQFVYTGEVSVEESDLASFLKTAATLKIKGLTDEDGGEMSTRAFQPVNQRKRREYTDKCRTKRGFWGFFQLSSAQLFKKPVARASVFVKTDLLSHLFQKPLEPVPPVVHIPAKGSKRKSSSSNMSPEKMPKIAPHDIHLDPVKEEVVVSMTEDDDEGRANLDGGGTGEQYLDEEEVGDYHPQDEDDGYDQIDLIQRHQHHQPPPQPGQIVLVGAGPDQHIVQHQHTPQAQQHGKQGALLVHYTVHVVLFYRSHSLSHFPRNIS